MDDLQVYTSFSVCGVSFFMELIKASCVGVSDLKGQISLFYSLGHLLWWERKFLDLRLCQETCIQGLSVFFLSS